MPETATPLTPQEIAARGNKLYSEIIEKQVASLKGQVVAINFMYTTCLNSCPVATARRTARTTCGT